jgi:hypothetical protein
LIDYLYRTSRVELLVSDDAGVVGKVDESERDFRARLAQVFREERDAVTEKLRAKYSPKFATLQERIRKAEQAVQREQEEASSSKWTSVLQVGASLMGALLGRKKVSAANAGRVVTASRSVGRSMKQSSDVTRAEENLDALQQQFTDLEQQFNQEVAVATEKLDATTVELSELVITPRKMDIKPRLVALAWVPHWRGADGRVTPAWE